MSVTFTVRLPRELAERMRRHREVNWSEVVRRAIEEFLEALEGSKRVVPASEVLEELARRGVGVEDLEPLEPGVEERMYAEMVRREWRRLSTIQAQ